MTSRKINIIVSLISALIGIGTLLILPNQISQETIASITNTNSPAFFPIVATFLVIFFSLILLFKTITLDRHNEKRSILIPYPGFLFIMFSIFTCYALLIWIVGMITASIFMIPAMSYVLGYRNKITIIAVAVSVPLALYILFEKFLLIILPHGFFF